MLSLNIEIVVTQLVLLWHVVQAAPYHNADTRSVNGPVIAENFQDPAVLKVGDTYYAYAGPNGNPAINVIYATSNDFSTWSVHSSEVLPSAGPWTASPPHVWAPDIVQLMNGKFVLYYAASTAQDNTKHCVGVATSDTPIGPFTASQTPLYCDLSSGGAIDADGFHDPRTGKQYVIYKVDGNSIGNGGACKNSVAPIMSTPLVLQEVSAEDGFQPVGTGTIVLTNDPTNDGPTIEAPSLAYDVANDQYVLFFSSGCFSQPSYSIQYATAPDVTGPYTRRGVWLATGGTEANVYVPGGADVEVSTGRIVFHGDLNMGWFQNDGSRRVRGMYAADVGWNGDGSVAIESLV